jgi:hypothetical protein
MVPSEDLNNSADRARLQQLWVFNTKFGTNIEEDVKLPDLSVLFGGMDVAFQRATCG